MTSNIIKKFSKNYLMETLLLKILKVMQVKENIIGLHRGEKPNNYG